MYGAILGDIIGSPYEFDMGDKTKDFPLFSKSSTFTDDTVLTIAIADALLDAVGFGLYLTDITISSFVIDALKEWGRKFPDAGYGGRFESWLFSDSVIPYNSCGNGSAMRVSSVGWLYDSIEKTRAIAKLTAEVTHNHPEGIKGAEATASAIYLARTGAKKEQIRKYIEGWFGYDLSRNCDEIRPYYHHTEICQQTVPEAIIAFLDSSGFEDAIRTAVSLGGDCDTVACITGSIAEAYYGVEPKLKKECINRIPNDMRCVVENFWKYVLSK